MWISSVDLCEKLNISRPCLYKLAEKKGWEHKFQRLPQGGRQKMYAFPDDEESKETKPKRPNEPVKPPPAPADDIPDLSPINGLPIDLQAQASLRARLCEMILETLADADSRIKAWKDVTKTYNEGKLLPELFQNEGKHGERTLRRWVKNYSDSDHDVNILVRNRQMTTPSRNVTETEKNFLLHILLTPNRVSIGSAIRKLKQMEMLSKLESPASKITLRRWCEEWQSGHKAEWNLLRNGRKSLRENSLISVLRSDELEVGDVWVADGHKLAFDILDPATGKPRRMIMIMFYDWASRYPVGASLAVSEDSQHILLALRNSILNWKGRPKYVYLDNGRAFRSKLFNQQWERHDLSQELAGIFPRLGIGVVFAESYNARAKVIERFFQTFQNDFERFMTTFRGGSIADKPATLMRNEKWMKKLFAGKPITVEQAKSMITLYIEQMYGMTPHGGLNGARPHEVFRSAVVPPEQSIEPSELNFLMLAVANRKVQASGIRFNNVLYWDEALINHVGDKVTLRHDLMDTRSVLVYDSRNRYICQASARRHQHPFVHLAKDKATSQKQLAKELANIRRLERNVKESSEQILLKVNDAVASIQLPEPDVTGELFSDRPIIDQPQRQLTVDDIVRNSAEDSEIQPQSNETNKDDDMSFAELMKVIGIG